MSAERAPRVAALVLAAGLSRRMAGVNKLLAPVAGVPLVARAVDAALASRAEPVVVVTGHEADRVRGALGGRPLAFAHNPDPARGLASSLAAGVAALGGDAVDGALVCLGDMPWVGAEVLDALIDAFARRPERPVCIPFHEERRGNPVLWPARHFAALTSLEGDVGGRALLEELAEPVHALAVACPGVLRDVDEPSDLASG